MNIFKDNGFWSAIAFIGASLTFGPLIAVMTGYYQDLDTARSIVLYIGAPVFISSVVMLMTVARFSKRDWSNDADAPYRRMGDHAKKK
jgi:1,4-dihydroxy-2-naphthoate octaprenyltransferase